MCSLSPFINLACLTGAVRCGSSIEGIRDLRPFLCPLTDYRLPIDSQTGRPAMLLLSSSLRELPDMMSASEGEGFMEKTDVVREVA